MKQELDINEVVNELTTRFAMKIASLEKENVMLTVANNQLKKEIMDTKKDK